LTLHSHICPTSIKILNSAEK